MSGMTLQERRRMFHRQNPECQISLYYLRLAYKEAGIKKKAIRIKKKIHPTHRTKINSEAHDALEDFDQAVGDGCRIIYCDELCTTR